MQQCQGVVNDVSVGRTLIEILVPNSEGWIDSLMWSEKVPRTARAKACCQISLALGLKREVKRTYVAPE